MSNLVRQQRDKEIADQIVPIQPLTGTTNPALAAPAQELSTQPLVNPTADLSNPPEPSAPEIDPYLSDITPEKLEVTGNTTLPGADSLPEQTQFPMITNYDPNMLFEGPTRIELKNDRRFIVPETQFVRNLPEQMLNPPVDEEGKQIFNSTEQAFKLWWDNLVGGLGTVFGQAWGSTDNQTGGPLGGIQERLVNGDWWQRLPFFHIPQLNEAANRAIDKVQTSMPNPDFGSGPLGTAFWTFSLPTNIGMSLAADIGKTAAQDFYGITGSTSLDPRTWNIDPAEAGRRALESVTNPLSNITGRSSGNGRVLPSPDGVPLNYTTRVLLGTDLGWSNFRQQETGNFNPFGVYGEDVEDWKDKGGIRGGTNQLRVAAGLALDILTGQPFDALTSGARRVARQTAEETGGAIVLRRGDDAAITPTPRERVYEGESVQPARELPPANRLESGTRRVQVRDLPDPPPSALPSAPKLQLPSAVQRRHTPDVGFVAPGVMRDENAFRRVYDSRMPGNIEVRVPTVRGYDVSLASVPKNVWQTIDISKLPSVAITFAPQARIADLARYAATTNFARPIDAARFRVTPRPLAENLRVLQTYTDVVPMSAVSNRTMDAVIQATAGNRNFLLAATSPIGNRVIRQLPAAQSFTPVVPAKLAEFTNRPVKEYTRQIIQDMQAIMPAARTEVIPSLSVPPSLPPVMRFADLDSGFVPVPNAPGVLAKVYAPEVPLPAIQREISNFVELQGLPYVPAVQDARVRTFSIADEAATPVPEILSRSNQVDDEITRGIENIANDLIDRGYVANGLEPGQFAVRQDGQVIITSMRNVSRVVHPTQIKRFRKEIRSVVDTLAATPGRTPDQTRFITSVQRSTKDMLEPSLVAKPEVYDEVRDVLPDHLRTVDGELTPEIAALTDNFVDSLDELEAASDLLKDVESQVFELSKLVDRPTTVGTIKEARPVKSLDYDNAFDLAQNDALRTGKKLTPEMVRQAAIDVAAGKRSANERPLLPMELPELVDGIDEAKVRANAANAGIRNADTLPLQEVLGLYMSRRLPNFNQDDVVWFKNASEIDGLLGVTGRQGEDAKYFRDVIAQAKQSTPVKLVDGGASGATIYKNADGTASKVIDTVDDPTAVKALHDEYDVIKAMPNKPYLMKVLDKVSNGYNMEFVEGTTFNNMQPEQLSDMLVQARVHMEDLADDGWILGDVHGGNVIMQPDGTIKFIDTGESYPVGSMSAKAVQDLLDMQVYSLDEMVRYMHSVIEEFGDNSADVFAMQNEEALTRLAQEIKAKSSSIEDVYSSLPDEVAASARDLNPVEVLQVVQSIRSAKDVAEHMKFEEQYANDLVNEVRIRLGLQPINGQSRTAFINDQDVWDKLTGPLYQRVTRIAGDSDIELEHVAEALNSAAPPGRAFQMDRGGRALARGRGSKAYVWDNGDGSVSKFIDAETTDPDRYQDLVISLQDEYALLEKFKDLPFMPQPVAWEGNGFSMKKIEGVNLIDYFEGDSGYLPKTNIPESQIDTVLDTINSYTERIYREYGYSPGDMHGANVMLDADGNVHLIDIADFYDNKSMSENTFKMSQRVQRGMLEDDLREGLTTDVVGKTNLYDAAATRATDITPDRVGVEQEIADLLGLEKFPYGGEIWDALPPGVEDALLRKYGDETQVTLPAMLEAVQQAVVRSSTPVTPPAASNIPVNNARVVPSITRKVVPSYIAQVDLDSPIWETLIRDQTKVDLDLPADVMEDLRIVGALDGHRITDMDALVDMIKQHKEYDAMQAVIDSYNSNPVDPERSKKLLAQAEFEVENQAIQVRADAETALNNVMQAEAELGEAVAKHNQQATERQLQQFEQLDKKRDANLGNGNRSECL